MFMASTGYIVVILVYALLAAIAFGIVYGAVRLAVTHALKSHTRWVDRGKP
ncbi:hypothetical protein R8Z57_03745 [Microbacterium sp. M3]|jgi:uncharacterized membrane protein YozB (DUF420 family)|uniref:Uncharacterized protein n=1 Tax=Microbacterium arthrosphaerae TaxID=792652 RepID=A0ABU4GXS7_9MICO|nr:MULTISPECIES: hypothetical protein [Microbacterium]MDW4571887.1 hypothetical protein [Microbacterium arthrosphaerae]MDW7605742.1 hypothetical protein [Microbacterium sp. M3]